MPLRSWGSVPSPSPSWRKGVATQPAREINERKQRLQIEHVRALLAYLEAGEPADMVFDPPLHVIRDDPGTLTVTFEGEAYVRFLPLAF